MRQKLFCLFWNIFFNYPDHIVNNSQTIDCLPTMFLRVRSVTILEDPGAVSPVRRKGRKFWSMGERARGYRLPPSYFQKFKRIPAPDWAEKMLCIIVPNRRTVSTEFFSWVPRRTWKLSSRLFSLPDWLPLGFRGCSVTQTNNLVDIRGLLLLWLEKLFCRSVCLSLLWKLMWTTATLGKFTNNATLTMRNMFVGNYYYLFGKSILPRIPRGG